ncbi:T9SS type A sorting domain-containing protein [Fulvivirga aurantia]|uniref:T9SS type A sorting domain-containing protein n=1 Tax=Fulvivirga aurantia TaxID=2529383 RepID=UPI001624742B|nr:T9SS type A sorting domain-containing protein [Fulvivirga aurantia]
MKNILTVSLLFILSTGLAQNVIIFEDFEGAAPGWKKSTPHTNEWYVLNTNSTLTSGSRSIGVSNDSGTTNAYSNVTTESAAWVSPTWPAAITSQNVTLQLDLRVNGQDDMLNNNIDYVSVYLVDVDDAVTIPTKNNLNGSNSFLLFEVNRLTNWNRGTVTLSAAAKSFINSSTNNTLLVFNWTNNATTANQTPIAIDNVFLTSSSTTTPPLAGDYQIGRVTNSDFATITNAFNYLNTYGQSADVNFYLIDEEYNRDFETFPLEIGDGTTTPYPGANTYNLTIKPDPVIAPTPTITRATNQFTANKESHGVITLWGVGNITIDGSNAVGGTSRDLTLIDNLPSSATNAPMGIYLAGINETDAMDNIELKNINISTIDRAVGYGIVAGRHGTSVIGHFADEAVFSNLTIRNNSFESVREAIHIDGADRNGMGGYTANSYATNITITENIMTSSGATAVQESGIHLLGVNGGTVSENTIANFNQQDLNADVGIIIDQNTQNLTVEKNEIYDLGFSGNNTSSLSAHGIDIYTGVANSAVVIKNNVIRNITGNGASSTANAGYLNPVAIFMGLGGEVGQVQSYTQSGFDIFNNSIYLFGQEMDFVTSVSMGLAVADNTSGVDVRNNIIKNTLGGATTLGGSASALSIFAQTSNAQFDNLNYNAHHIAANTTFTNNYIGLIGTLADLLTDADTDMSSWRVTTGDEASSIHAAPGYTSTTNLLPDNTNANSWHVHGVGEPIASVTDDFTGASRSTTVTTGAVDLGAYEFTNDPVTNPPTAITQSGPLFTGTVYTFSIGERGWVQIEFNPGSDLPDDISLQVYSGSWPGDQGTLNIFNNYFDITATENANTNYSYNMTVYYDEAYLGTVSSESEPSLHISQDENISGTWTYNTSTVNTTSNTITVNNLTGFGRFGGTSNSNALPVEYLTIKAIALENINQIKWATATEINSQAFIVERSTNGKDWLEIGEVAAAGNSSSKIDYDFTDYEPKQVSYYRLNQIDYDGTENLSDVLKVTRDFDESVVSVFPNPFRKTILVRNLPQGEEVDVQVSTIAGNNVYSQDIVVNNGLKIELPELKDGVYVLKLTFGDQTILRKIMRSDTQNTLAGPR